jgi:ubiquinone/menaquinone biosynthesis C-methylase UbiE
MIAPTNTANKSPYCRFSDFNPYLVHLFDGAKVLDLCCGYGTPVINQLGEVYALNVVSVDYYIENFEKLTYFSERVQANAISLPFQNNSFDAVVCGEMIAENPFFQSNPNNIFKLRKEIARILKPRGLQILANEFLSAVPETFQEVERSKHFSRNKVFWAIFKKQSL